RAEVGAELPNFLGSTLRGAFGHALKRTVCVMERRDCENCLVAPRCLYQYLFETPPPEDAPQLRGHRQAPHPFIFEPPLAEPEGRRQSIKRGESLNFGFMLLGRAIDALPYVIYAIEMMARGGLGVERARFELTGVNWRSPQGESRPIYEPSQHRIASTPETAPTLDEYLRRRLADCQAATRLRLRFLTPTRIRIQGDAQASMGFDLFADNLWRRAALLLALHGSKPFNLDKLWWQHETDVRCVENNLRWWDWERRSNRQKRNVKMGGFVGEIEYEGEELIEYLPLILAGELLHVGGGTGFGLGRYEIIR
ncbi:MAG TPA: CRISPR system precrRNA processing endoribonuclease RAMP protein Cas6, partial [Blastocatellia bacterium]